MYKASRRREYERVKMMDEEMAREKADEAFEKKREELSKKDLEKTEKNRRRRDKKKMKNKGKDGAVDVEDDRREGQTNVKTKLSRVTLPGPKQGDDSGDEVPATTAEDVGVIIHDDD